MTLKGSIERMKASDGKVFLEFGTLILLRNHTRLVMHSPELLTIWRGNRSEANINCRTESEYIIKYMKKPEVGYLKFSNIVKQLTEKAN